MYKNKNDISEDISKLINEIEIIDIHTHLLPDYDDGPPNVDGTREMLQVAVRDGTKELVVTPHILNTGDYQREKEIRQKEYFGQPDGRQQKKPYSSLSVPTCLLPSPDKRQPHFQPTTLPVARLLSCKPCLL